MPLSVLRADSYVCSLFIAIMTRKEQQRFYHSGLWKSMRESILRRDHCECQECRRKMRAGLTHKINRARLVHHIIPYDVDPTLGLDPDNLISLCDGCHNAIHGRDKIAEYSAPIQRKKRATDEKW